MKMEVNGMSVSSNLSLPGLVNIAPSGLDSRTVAAAKDVSF